MELTLGWCVEHRVAVRIIRRIGGTAVSRFKDLLRIVRTWVRMGSAWHLVVKIRASHFIHSLLQGGKGLRN